VRVPGIAVPVGPAAKVPAVMVVVSMFVMVVFSVSMSHVFLQMQFRYIELKIYLNRIGADRKPKMTAREQKLLGNII
jgi:hypothetical protein